MSSSPARRGLFAEAGAAGDRTLVFAAAPVTERSTPGCGDQSMALASERVVRSQFFKLTITERCLSGIEAEHHGKRSETLIRTSQSTDSSVGIFSARSSVLD